MPRAIWSGSISFGLVNVPIRLFSAVSQKEVHFHMLHDADGGRIQFKRVCSTDGQEVPFDHIVKGYEVSKGRYITITPEELSALDPKATRTIEIEDFVDLSQIDPVYYESTYYLAPDKGAGRAYRLLLDAMKQSGKVAIARFVMRTRQYLCAVRPMGEGLALSTMQYPDEIVDQGDIELPGPEQRTTERELQMARQLVESLSTSFDPDKYQDDYRARLLELVERKAEGEQIVAAPEPEAPVRVINLVDALQASLDAAKKRGPPAEKAVGPAARREREEAGASREEAGASREEEQPARAARVEHREGGARAAARTRRRKGET